MKTLALTASGVLPERRCPFCHALLYKGLLIGEIRCRACKKDWRTAVETISPLPERDAPALVPAAAAP